MAVSLLLAVPPLAVGFTPEVPRILFWASLGSGIYLYFRVRRQGLLPAYDNLRISVVGVLAVTFVALQLIGLLWVVLWW